ncbi:MAG: prolipoprotein diacylglyceryl transferase, partial [Aliifodinibius sp.]|nr:prolipoprotein diacylglyceryl transferase [Fodinibius sp.]
MISFSAQYFSIFGFKIYYYGLILMSGVVAALLLVRKQANKRGMDEDFLFDSVPWILFGGIVGARLWHIFTPPPSMIAQGLTTEYYLKNPLAMLNLRAGGLGIPGAVIGGIAIFFWYAWRKKQPFVDWLDVFAPAIPLGQAIGRWGNFVNQELYGAPTSLPWAIYIEPKFRMPGYADQDLYHPLFLYESLWNLGSVFLLLWISNKFKGWLKSGDVFLFYLVSYPLIRIILDFFRLDASQIGGINANQTFMI